MVDSCVRVKISYKNDCILDENSQPVETNDLKELIDVLRDTQRKTNECLTRLTIESDPVAPAEETSDVSEDDSEDDDLGKITAADIEDDVSPKRAKLKN